MNSVHYSPGSYKIGGDPDEAIINSIFHESNLTDIGTA